MSKRTELTEAKASEIAGAIQRLNELGDSTIINPATEAEVKGLRNYLANTLPQYANELLGCWFVMHNEYEPLIQGFAGLFGRATALLHRNQPGPAVQTDKPETPPAAEVPDNVVPLNS